MNRIVKFISAFSLLVLTGQTAFADPTSAFTYSFPLDCAGENIQFINNSSTLTGSIVLTIWDFGDGNSSAVSSPSHVYEESGNYTVKLTIYNSDGDHDVSSQIISVNPIPQVNFQLVGSDQCESQNQVFDNLSSIPSADLTYSWDFGDGTASTDEEPSHLFDGEGAYSVILTATSTSTSCESSITKVVTIHPEETVSFSASDVCYGNEVVFENTSTNGADEVGWLWDFDDGTFSSEKTPNHLYSTPGVYDVSLQATTDQGCITSVNGFVNVYEQPIADFATNNGCFEVEASFTNSSQFSDSFVWYFGDGTTSMDENPTHEYASFGTYDVALVSSNADGCRDSISKSLSIYPLPVAGFTVENSCFGSVTIFGNTSQITSGTLSYNWDFGDGTASTDANPQHSYASAGVYDVKLRVTSDQGCFTELTKQISIFEQPEASFTVEDVCADLPAVFTNTSTGSSVTCSWNFGDGQSSTDSDPSHQYLAAGTYLVTLDVESSEGCHDSFSKQVTIKPLPTVNFSFQSACDTITVPFFNLSTITSGSISYEWAFGDGESSTEVDPSHLYPTHGSYQVKLTGTSVGGCVANRTKPINIYARPQADFDVQAVCDGSISVFSNTSTIGEGYINKYQWDFGDGSNSIVKDPEKQYFNSGDYPVSLTIFSDKGCESALTETVTVYEFPIANFSVENVCFGLDVAPQNTSTIGTGDLKFSWDFGDGTEKTGFSPSHRYEEPGVYTISLRATSSPGCEDLIKKDVRVYDVPPVNAGLDTAVSQGFPVELSATGAVDYLWYPIEGLSNSNIPNPRATPDVTTTYVVEGTDQYGCSASDSVTVYVDNDYKLVVNNVFTPDGNGQNDAWVIQNVETFGTVNVRVYDRYGSLVFHDQAYQNDWTGTSGRDILPDGTYYYLITFSDSSKKYKGAITILRNR